MSCHHAPGGLQDILDEVWKDEKKPIPTSDPTALPLVGVAPLPPKEEKSTTLTPFQFAKKVEKLLDEYLRPMVQKDGGDLELIDIKDATVYIELKGACVNCAGAGQTLKFLVERTLREKVDERIRVIQV